jgi:cytochrome c peroxidase
MKWLIGIGLLFSSFIMLINCSRNATNSLSAIPYQPTPITLNESDRLPKMVIPPDNPMTAEGIALGRKLFFDPIFSRDSTFSCGSCHLPERAFSDSKAVAIGIRMRKGRRSSPSLVNVGYNYTGFFWDGRSMTLEDQTLHPVVDSVEMGNTWDRVEESLQQHPDYPVLFRKAFGIESKAQITKDLIAKAIAQFERTLISKNAKFDQVQRGEAQYTEAEQRGFAIFFDTSSVLPHSECAHCHADPLFTTLEYQNNGIQKGDNLNFRDLGRGAITGNRYDNGKFKIPTLRNIALTAPYMHDGRFRTLEQVLDHYASGGHPAENVSPNVRKLNFTERDKADLIAFLNTLTDTTYFK